MKGTIIRVFLNKGYGFVRGEDGISRFMHAKEVHPPEAFDTMREGQAVEFTPVVDEHIGKGNRMRASGVKLC